MRYLSVYVLFLFGVSAQAQFITNNGMNLVNATTLTVNGDWVNVAAPGAPSGPAIVNNGIITTRESWNSAGTLSGKGAFVLEYATDKNFAAENNSIGTLIKKGAGSVLVSGSIHIADTLMLNNGLLKLSGVSDTVVIHTPVVVSNAGSYIEGLVAHQGTGDRLYPLGRDGLYLPLKLYRMNVSKATASVEPALPGYTKGGGVEALIDFPYVWKVSGKTAADTSAYVEVSYPNTLPVASNPIVVRSVPGNQYASMGARYIDKGASIVTVRSYSRGLKGMFSVAKGFPSDFKTDSLALVALYNTTNGTGWTNKTNWLQQDVNQWAGVTVTGQSITSLNLANNKLKGPVTDLLADILSLQTINLSGNEITSIPAFTDNPEIKTLNVSGNRLEFGPLEANAVLLDPAIAFTYTSQADIGTAKETQVNVGENFDVKAETSGTRNAYRWKRNGVTVPDAKEKVYTIQSIGRANMGEYVCEITNPLFPELTIRTAPQKAEAIASVSGKLYAHADEPATKGTLTLFRVNTGKYDTAARISINTDGSYRVEKVVLADYQLLGFADTLTHAHVLPTYYKNTIFWEEADTVFLEGNVDNLNITSISKPTPSSGRGSITGFLEEDVPDTESGRVDKAKRVSGAGVSARRVENVGRGKEEILTLVAYVFTDENGEFTLPNLPEGIYRLNFQYPGYPMDENSFTTITIGKALQSQVTVEANVVDGKISVRKMVVTGIADAEEYDVAVYPNPAVDFVKLAFGSEKESRSISLLDAGGRHIMASPAAGKETVLNVQQLNNGLYFLRIDEEGVTKKVYKISIE